MFHKPLIFSNLEEIIAFETTRIGGISPHPFEGLNLGRSSGDEPENVLENKRLLAKALDIRPEQFVTGHQTHGDEVILIKKAGNFNGFDAKISNERGLYLTVTVADCVPTLIFDKKKQSHRGCPRWLAGLGSWPGRQDFAKNGG